ncbi:MAG: hypothetical protein JWO87_1803 [Phycisphaerales bacterium]|nr:hypothetical protein [Phycisphaerales bacterium]
MQPDHPDKTRALDYRTPDPRADRQRLTHLGIRVLAGVLLLVAVLAVVGVSTFLILSGRLDANLLKAREHIPIIQSRIAGDDRFKYIVFEAGTQSNGCVWVGGTVANPSDLAALRQIIQNTSPPVPVVYHVGILPIPSESQPAPAQSGPRQ